MLCGRVGVVFLGSFVVQVLGQGIDPSAAAPEPIDRGVIDGLCSSLLMAHE